MIIFLWSIELCFIGGCRFCVVMYMNSGFLFCLYILLNFILFDLYLVEGKLLLLIKKRNFIISEGGNC